MRTPKPAHNPPGMKAAPHSKFVIVAFDNSYSDVTGLLNHVNYTDRLLLGEWLYYVPLNCPISWSDERVTEWTFERVGLLPLDYIPRVVPPNQK